MNWDDTKTLEYSFAPKNFYESSDVDNCKVYEFNGTIDQITPDAEIIYKLKPHESKALKFKCLPF